MPTQRARRWRRPRKAAPPSTCRTNSVKRRARSKTEAELNLDKTARIDLQLRLSALGHSIGSFDGSLGPRSRAAIGAWQRQSGIVETTYLTPQQHMFLVVQTDPMMAQVRAQYESDKAAAQKRQSAQKAVRTNKTTKKTQTANTSTRKKKTQTASDDVPYKPRNKGGTRVDNGNSGVGAFVGGALLGAAVGAAVGH